MPATGLLFRPHGVVRHPAAMVAAARAAPMPGSTLVLFKSTLSADLDLCLLDMFPHLAASRRCRTSSSPPPPPRASTAPPSASKHGSSRSNASSCSTKCPAPTPSTRSSPGSAHSAASRRRWKSCARCGNAVASTLRCSLALDGARSAVSRTQPSHCTGGDMDR
ncbi:hypothetical protein SETIT_9G216900v2, partial [Setaria italica]